MSFQQSALFLGKVVLFFRQIAGKTIALQGPHMCGPQLYGRRPPAGRPRAGRLSAHNERRQFASKHARAVVCPAGANIVRSTLTTPQCPAPTAQLGSSSASTRQPFSVGTNRTVVTVAVSGTIVSSPAQPSKSSLSQVSESCQNARLPSGCSSGSVKRCPQ